MQPAFADDATPIDFWVVLPRPSRASALLPTDGFPTIRRVSRARSPANPAMGFVGFSRVCRMPFQGHVIVCACARHRARTQLNRNSPQPYLSLAAIRSWVLRRLKQWTCARAHSEILAMSFEQQRRHPCRRRPFSVFGRFAPSHSERSRSSHYRYWGRASVSERLPV